MLSLPTSEPRSPRMSDVLNLNELTERCMGNVEFALKVLHRFEDRLQQDVAELQLAATGGDLELTACLAHRIKGAAANVAAHALLKVAAEIETAAREQDCDLLWSRLPVLDVEQDRFRKSIPQISQLLSQTA